MRLRRPEIARAFVDQADKHGIDHAVKELAALMLEDRIHEQIEEIILDIAEVYRDKHGVIEADVSSAFKLSTELKKKLVERVKESTGAKKVILHEAVDSSLLAGVVLSAPDMELDLSLKTKLSKLRA